MSNLWIAVYSDAKSVALGEPIQEEAVSYTTSSVQSNAIIPTTGKKLLRSVRIFSDSDCFVTWNENPTATTDGTSGRPVGANNPEYFGIKSGSKIAVIQRT